MFNSIGKAENAVAVLRSTRQQYLSLEAMQVPVQLLHEAIEAAVALAVAPALHLPSALRA